MALHSNPRAPGSNGLCLVVVAITSAGGERIIEPEVSVTRDFVGDVGEGCGALVRGDDKIVVVAVMAEHAVWWHYDVVDDVVGHIKQRTDEDLVAGHDLRHDLVA